MFFDDEKPLQNYDKIEFKNSQEVQKILTWRDNNKDLVRNFNFVLEKGYIDLQHNSIKIVFKKIDETVYLDMLMKRNNSYQHFHTIIWDYIKKTISIIHPSEEIIKNDSEFFEENNHSLITIFASTMAFMEHYKEYKDVVKSNKKFIQKSSKKNKKNKKNKMVRKISKTVYNLNFESEHIFNEKRSYELNKDISWNVKGHWREYKDGKKIWVKPYKKGNKEVNENPVIYKM